MEECLGRRSTDRFVGRQRQANLARGQMWKDRMKTSNWPKESKQKSLSESNKSLCRSHQRCGTQRCAAPPSGVPLTPAVWHSAVCRSNQRCAAATIACTSGADISESASEDFEPDMLSPPLSQICLNLKCISPQVIRHCLSSTDGYEAEGSV